MSEHAALLKRLEQIAAQPCPCEERIGRALALVKAYIGRLYVQLGIGSANRLTADVKTVADQVLAELRRRVLAAEVDAPPLSQSVFTAVRHRLDMRRRVLAARIADTPQPAAAKRVSVVPAAISTDFHQDWQILTAMKQLLLEREHVARSRAAIEESLGLLGIEGMGVAYALRYRLSGSYRPRLARFGSLSGQLTM